MIYKNEKTSCISFPLGGLGGGCIGLAGNGRLIDWEIFNRPNKGSLNGFSHIAVKAYRHGKLLDARVLNGDLQPPYTGITVDASHQEHLGFGYGPQTQELCGLPHFRKFEFKGEYPFARINFEESHFPGNVNLCAWSPFIPGNEDDSGIPVACFEVEFENPSTEETDYVAAFSLQNPFTSSTANNRFHSDGQQAQLTLSSHGNPEDRQYGDITLTTLGDNVSYQEYWYRGMWNDSLEVFWDDFSQKERFQNRRYPTKGENRDHGTIACHLRLRPKERKTARFLLTWNIPNCYNYWDKDADAKAEEAGQKNHWKNWYATRWEDSRESGRYALESYDRLRAQTLSFAEALHTSTIPSSVTEGVAANLSILKSPTCMRLEDGTFYGWEGATARFGSCHGSCTHVWGYNQALPFLFPRLERSMRSSHYNYSVDANGGSHFRLSLPLGMPPNKHERERPCIDGQMGEIIKFWRDWKISGDMDWLKRHWPTVKKTLEFAWNPKNPDRWDPQQSGVITGRQHHTLDMELFGPSAWLNGHYLGALKAVAEIAGVMGEPEFAQTCEDVFKLGKAWTDANLFNGEYYIQKVDIKDKSLLESFCTAEDNTALRYYWSEEHGEIKYQIGEGCEIDMHLPQWYASMYGLGEVLDKENVRKTLESTYRYNYKSMRDVVNVWRNYAVNDERGVLICTWPHGGKPTISVPYHSETMHGFEWALACHLIMTGMEAQGLTVVTSIRERYDGQRRNPWNEFECGSNYARSLASYGLINAYSGLKFDAGRKAIGFHPLGDRNLKCFWSLGDAWGTYTHEHGTQCIELLHGELPLRELHLSLIPSKLSLGGAALDFKQTADGIQLTNDIVITSGQTLKMEP